MQVPSRLMAGLLGAVLILQLWTLNRQSQLEQQLQSLRSGYDQEAMRTQAELGSMQSSLSEMADANRWVSVQNTSVTPGADCQSAEARLEWDLREWTPGTTVKLLYRAASDQAWQEATVSALGGSNYAGTFRVTGRPLLIADGIVEWVNVRSGGSAGSTSGVDKSLVDRDYQYQIVAEGPGFNRSTGVRSIPTGGTLATYAKIVAIVEQDRWYRVDLRSGGPSDVDSCAKLEGAEVRTYVGDRLVGTIALTAEHEAMRSARWQSDESLTRLEVVVRHGGTTDIVTLDVTNP